MNHHQYYKISVPLFSQNQSLVNNFEELHSNAKLFLKEYPASWIAMTYLALAKFWLGTDDYSHIPEVIKILNKAENLSKRNEFVLDAIEKIANNSTIFCSKHNKLYGQDLDNSINIFNLFIDNNILNNEAKEYINEYCLKSYDRYKKELVSMEKRLSKSQAYNPPYTAVKNLYHLGIISENDDILKYFYIQSEYHKHHNKTKSYFSDLEKMSDKVSNILLNKNISLPKVKIKKFVNSEGCFIVTAVLGNQDNPLLDDFRYFRDNYLIKTSYGKKFIKIYYRYSPSFADIICINNILRKLL